MKTPNKYEAMVIRLEEDREREGAKISHMAQCWLDWAKNLLIAWSNFKPKEK